MIMKIVALAFGLVSTSFVPNALAVDSSSCNAQRDRLRQAQEYVRANEKAEREDKEGSRQCLARARAQCQKELNITHGRAPCGGYTTDAQFATIEQCGVYGEREQRAYAEKSRAGAAAVQKANEELTACEAAAVAVAESNRRAAEARDQEEAAARQRVEERRGDNAWMRPAISGALCAYQTIRKGCINAIATEKKYARIGGVVSKSKLYGFQQAIREADGGIREVLAILKSRHLSAAPCSGTVAAIAQCLGNSEASACKEARVAEHIELLPTADYDSCDE